MNRVESITQPCLQSGMDPIQPLVGNWRIRSDVAPEEEFMHIDPEGRIVHFVCADETCTRKIPVKLWVKFLVGVRYSVRAKLDGDCWVVEMISTTEGIRIHNGHKTFDFTAAADSDLPDWFEHRLEKALAEMAEAEQLRENQD